MLPLQLCVLILFQQLAVIGSSPDPQLENPASDIDPLFECAWRAVAYDYGRALMPRYGAFGHLFDALQLGSACNKSFNDFKFESNDGPRDVLRFDSGQSIFVDFAHGSDQYVLRLHCSRAEIPVQWTSH